MATNEELHEALQRLAMTAVRSNPSNAELAESISHDAMLLKDALDRLNRFDVLAAKDDALEQAKNQMITTLSLMKSGRVPTEQLLVDVVVAMIAVVNKLQAGGQE